MLSATVLTLNPKPKKGPYLRDSERGFLNWPAELSAGNQDPVLHMGSSLQQGPF